ncbi:unnamed protein product [Rotaria sordida]|uniref:Uncharacterized protein n=1 Tax=Rotaria sordida TaxID=392033 RepID=A0A814BMH5_9BILA|nr:unnamed protein product [Rotaria sordida]CAF0930635.1 unnamed protein product [Rotaria sordida]
MQTKTFLVLFSIIVVLLIDVNDGAPAAPKLVVVKEESSKPTIICTAWKTNIDARSKKFFNENKPIISKKLQTIHKIPTTFVPKPSKVATQVVNGFLHHYLVK